MTISNYFKYKWTKSPIKGQRVAKWVKTKIHLYIACKRHISDIEIHTD